MDELASEATPAPCPNPSQGITCPEAARLPPIPPRHLAVKRAGTESPPAIILRWEGTGDDTLAYYQLYRRAVSAQRWRKRARVQARGENTGPYTFRDGHAHPAQEYVYGVSAVSRYGLASQIVACQPITAAAGGHPGPR